MTEIESKTPVQSNKERLKEITDSIESGIQELFQSERYAEYLRTMSRFHRYSVNNTLLIFMQKPDATRVAGFNKWRDQFERHVKKGERGITIIAPAPFKKKIEQDKIDPDTHQPMVDENGQIITEEKEIQIPMFRPAKVFDVSQTEGKPLPQLAADLTGNVQDYELFMEALKRSAPVPMSIEPITDGSDGYFSSSEQRIVLRDGMSEVQTVSAAVHEIAHSILHNYQQEPSEDKPQKKDRRTEEVEAESISFAVCAYYGIATGENSFGYIAGWSKDKELDELKASLETINKTASGIITDIDRHYAELRKERDKALDEPEIWQNLYNLDDKQLLHILYSDSDAWDYSFYDPNTLCLLDGGVLDEPDFNIREAREAILKLHGLTPELIVSFTPEAMDAKLDAINKVMIDSLSHPCLPDPSVSIAAMQHYGYENDSILPLSRDRARELFTKDMTVYMLYPDGTEAMVFDTAELDTHNGMFGVAREEWESLCPKGTEQENYLRSAEMSAEDDYDMIDGILNNGSKDTAEKRPSLLEQLHKPLPETHKTKTAPHKSAEMEI